jgi:hypothetical protein
MVWCEHMETYHKPPCTVCTTHILSVQHITTAAIQQHSAFHLHSTVCVSEHCTISLLLAVPSCNHKPPCTVCTTHILLVQHITTAATQQQTAFHLHSTVCVSEHYTISLLLAVPSCNHKPPCTVCTTHILDRKSVV